MDIYSKPGARVVFSFPTSGHDYDQANAAKYLKLRHHYTIDRTDVDNWHTSVWLREVPEVSFNSVQFTNAPKRKRAKAGAP